MEFLDIAKVCVLGLESEDGGRQVLKIGEGKGEGILRTETGAL